MKCLSFFLAFVYSIAGSYGQRSSDKASFVVNDDSLQTYDKVLSLAEMRSDLVLFRDIRAKANSGLYRYRSLSQIDSIYKAATALVKKPLKTSEFYKIILTLTDFEGSCHNYTELEERHLNYLRRAKNYFPYSLKYIEGKIIFNQDSAVIPLGSRVVSINGIPDTSLMQSFYKYFPADGFTITEKLSASVNAGFGFRYLLEYGLADSFLIRYSIQSSPDIKSITVYPVTSQERDKNIATRHSAPVDNIVDYKVSPSHSFKMVTSSIAILNFKIFSMASGVDDPAFQVYVRFIDSVFTELDKNKVSNLIIDLRGNPGGSDPMFEQPMLYLTDKPFRENTLAYTIFDEVPYQEYFWGIATNHKMDEQELIFGKQFLKGYFPKLNRGKNFQDPKHNPVYQPKSPAFRGKIYLLIDESVASAGSHLASLIKAYAHNLTVVGVETCGGYYGHNGHMPMVYELPNSKIKTKFSIVYVVQDAPLKADQPVGRGIIPDYEVWPGFDDFINNKDTQMEFVLSLISGGKRVGK